MSQTHTKIVLPFILCSQIGGFALLAYQQTHSSAVANGMHGNSILVQQLSDNVQVVRAKLDQHQSEQRHIYADSWRATASPSGPMCNNTPQHAPITAQEISELVRSVIQQELDDLVADWSPRSGYGQETLAAIEETSSVDDVDSDVRAQAMVESNSIVDAALERGEWFTEDSDLLIRKIAFLDRAQTIALVSKIGRAVNSQQLRVDATVSMPF